MKSNRSHDVLDLPLNGLGLSVHAQESVKGLKVNTLGELALQPLERLKAFDEATLDELQSVLKKHGLSLENPADLNPLLDIPREVLDKTRLHPFKNQQAAMARGFKATLDEEQTFDENPERMIARRQAAFFLMQLSQDEAAAISMQLMFQANQKLSNAIACLPDGYRPDVFNEPILSNVIEYFNRNSSPYASFPDIETERFSRRHIKVLGVSLLKPDYVPDVPGLKDAKDLLRQVLTDAATAPDPVPPQIVRLGQVLNALHDCQPDDKQEFVDAVGKLLERHAYCIKIHPDGVIARKMYVNANNSLGYKCTDGSALGLSQRTPTGNEPRRVELIPYSRPTARRQNLLTP